MIDKYFAPKGFYAVAGTKVCLGCAFFDVKGACKRPVEAVCLGWDRPDGISVIFKKKEAHMSKIYSTVDADEAEHLIGKEVYFGDTLTGIKEHGKKGTLKRICDADFFLRFVETEHNSWGLIQEVEQSTYHKIETIDEAETFFGKVARSKDGTTSFIVSYVYVQRGTVYIDGHPTSVLLADYTIDGKPFGIEVKA